MREGEERDKERTSAYDKRKERNIKKEDMKKKYAESEKKEMKKTTKES